MTSILKNDQSVRVRMEEEEEGGRGRTPPLAAGSMLFDFSNHYDLMTHFECDFS